MIYDRNAKRAKTYSDYLDAILRVDVESRGLELDAKARSYWQDRITEFFDDTSKMIFETKEKSISDLTQRTQTVTGSAIAHALDAGRNVVLAEDIEYSLKIHICSGWPFCRKR